MISSLDALLYGVDKPARYTGGELNAVVKEKARLRLALCFPDVYEVAESHLGLKILYHVVNARHDLAAERVYAPWPDFEKRLRDHGIPLFSLETHRPLNAFDLIGFTLQYELSLPTLVAMLHLGRVPARATSRHDQDPLVIAGGPGAFNAEPVADFFDAILLGDGEQAILEIAEAVAACRGRRASRSDMLTDLAGIEGVYVPSHFEPIYHGLNLVEIRARPGTPGASSVSRHGTPRVKRRAIADLDAAPFPTRPIVPNIQPVHHRVAVEIQRGCTHGCRFCQAGMITRPTRQRQPQTVLGLASRALAASGCDSVGLLSLSAGDYPAIDQVLTALFARYADERINVSLPSLRTESMTPELAERLATARKSGFTIAPEAGSERLRRVINKTNTDADLMTAVRAAVEAGWRRIKLYFMIGLPTETEEDVDAIATLAERARRAARRVRRNADITVSVSTFVPKPHTPFQWEAQLTLDQTRCRQQRLRDRLRKSRIPLRYHSPEQSFAEGVLSRGDRRLAEVIETAAKEGCRLDAWTEHYDHQRWLHAFATVLARHGLTADDYLRPRSLDALLPWDHLDSGLLKKFLLRDRCRAYAQETVADCAFTDQCLACGGCDVGNPTLTAKQRRSAGGSAVALQPTMVAPDPDDPNTPATSVPAAGRTASTAKARSRLRFCYAKTGRAVHLSHLDAMEQILRAIRQSGLPALYSEGHVPRQRVGFSPACPTGVESRAEYFEVECSGYPNPASYSEALSRLLPQGMEILEATEVPRSTPAIGEQLCSTTYRVDLPDSIDLDACRQALARLQGADSMPVQVRRKRRVKLLDARIALADATLHGHTLRLTLAFARRGTLKIFEAIALLAGRRALEQASIVKESVTLGFERLSASEPPMMNPASPVFDLTDVADNRQRQPA